jgi:hypothetical protein
MTRARSALARTPQQALRAGRQAAADRGEYRQTAGTARAKVMRDVRFASGCLGIAVFFAILALGPHGESGPLLTYIQGESGPTLFTYICGLIVAIGVVGGVNNLHDLREEDREKASARRAHAEVLEALTGRPAHRLPGRWFWYLLVAILIAVVLGLFLR